MVNCQGSYYSVSYGPTALKICHDTVHQKIASLSRQETQTAGPAKWPTTLRFGKILGTTSVVKSVENP